MVSCGLSMLIVRSLVQGPGLGLLLRGRKWVCVA